MSDNGTLLSVKDLSVHFFTREGIVRAVQEVGFSIKRGQTFALVGESGCGKSTTAISIIRLLPKPQGKIVGGQIIFEGQNLLLLSERRMRQIRGNRIAMIFQEPTTSLNPVYTIGNQIAEAVKLHQKTSGKEAWAAAVETLRKAGVPDPARRAWQYPHELSGGMQQRAMIAMAVSCRPALLIADEPTTALDVTIQAQILELLDELRKQIGMSILLITHNLTIVAERAERVAVMYASRIVEIADTKRIFAEPLHPYTQGLLESLPRMGFPGKRLHTIPGAVPAQLHLATGCKFHPRCSIGGRDKRCRTTEPELKEIKPGRWVACWHAPEYKTS